jgi:hypothetical protein
MTCPSGKRTSTASSVWSLSQHSFRYLARVPCRCRIRDGPSRHLRSPRAGQEWWLERRRDTRSSGSGLLGGRGERRPRCRASTSARPCPRRSTRTWPAARPARLWTTNAIPTFRDPMSLGRPGDGGHGELSVRPKRSQGGHRGRALFTLHMPLTLPPGLARFPTSRRARAPSRPSPT